MRPLAGYPLGAGTRCGRIERQQARQELFFVGRAPRSTSRWSKRRLITRTP